MQLFLSTFQNKIDKKGRVSVPASFRAVLSEQAFQGIVVFRSLTLQAIEGFSMARMEKLSQDLDQLDVFSQDYEDWTASIFADSHQLPFDSEGRVQLPEFFCTYAGITDVVAFIGRGKSFQLWNPSTFLDYQNSARNRLKNKEHGLRAMV
ncbi:MULTISPECIES: division/cell wall cluster transcriptional repressor MraZ [Holospora]|uniref:Transcriptional regulator MraZ n=2 Tax=Holospora TaxID=44747 RepID=A0A061JHR0_9PROT|nr:MULTISPECIES: division/cell wall cluster transcriptional repressor MraZ [Holospora]ETZ04923.1 protein MraZ [Holospora undulata HU1]GAJ46316.1 protein MraZ [Holospora elegans E1]